MSAPIDVQAVIAPLAGNDPVGVDVREPEDPGFGALRQQVEEAKRRRRMIERGDPSDAPDWTGVAAGSAALLATKSKDIQVLSWLIEASGRAYGLEGLACALESAAALITQYLPQMYPRPQSGDEEFRLQPLVGLDNNGTGTLIPLINQQAIISAPGMNGGGANGAGVFTVLHQQQAKSLDQLDPEKREQRVRGGAVTTDQINRAASRMTGEQVAETRTLLDRAIKATETLRDGFLKHCGPDAPPTSGTLEALEACRSMLAAFTKDKHPVAPAGETNGAGAAPSGNANGSTSASGRGSVSIGAVQMDRESVLSAISRLVAALDSLEPQNLAVPALQQAITWARMDRVALLTDLLDTSGGDTARDKLFRLIGLKAPVAESENDG